MFGMEIRRIGQLANLYRDADLVLQKLGVEHQGEVPKVMGVSAAAHAINKMLKVDRYFDITTIQQCSKVCSIVVSAERMEVYRTMHCVHWNEMLPEFRQALIAMVLDDFRSVFNP